MGGFKPNLFRDSEKTIEIVSSEDLPLDHQEENPNAHIIRENPYY